MLLQQFQEYLKINFPFLQLSKKLLLAVSGGMDSVVMTDLFHNTGFDFVIAHCNFQLRGEESERDETFVKSLSKKYNKEVLIKSFDTEKYTAEKSLSVQEAARKLRYDWFMEIRNSKFEFRNFLATAHNADDNVETALMFFLRGSGIHGLTGIPVFDKERKIIRPLLFASGNEIEGYAKENNLSWVEDSSNATEKYTRNFLRNNIIPSLQQYFPRLKENLNNNIKRLKEVEELYNQSIQQHKKNLLEFKANEVHIPVLKLQKTKPLDAIIWEIVKEYDFHPHQIDEIKKLFTSDNSSYIKSSTHRVIKNRNWLIIAPNKSEEASHILIEEDNAEIKFERGSLLIEQLQTANHKLQTANNIAQLDAKHIQFPLLLRKWKAGDYFYPLGMKNLPAGRQGKKKLSRFFIDQKLSATEKENIWLLESNKKIIWVIGYRIDERFKLTATTKQILKLLLIHNNQR